MKDHVYVYVFDTMADWEIAYITAELHTGKYFKKGQPQIKLITMGNTKEPITTMGGLKVCPETDLSCFELDAAAALILPGGDTWLEPLHEPILSLAGTCLGNGILVAAICGATFGLARYGLLTGFHHTSNDLGFLKAVCPGYTAEAYYHNVPAITDRNLITAPGIAPVEFTVEILKYLDVFLPEALAAWQKLYTEHDSASFFELMRLTGN